jgi:hypothetical protein
MAVPILAPFAPLIPLIKVLALGSVKFVGVGIGAAVAPVLTANFLVGLAAGTPLKYAQFRHQKGLFSQEQLQVIENANQLVQDSIDNQDQHMSRSEAREFLKQVLAGTLSSMKTTVLTAPSQVARFTRLLLAALRRPFSGSGNP